MIKSLFGVVLLIALLFKPLSSSFVQPHPNRCGDVEIVYPFGIGLKHSLNDDFEVTCNPKPILTKFNLQILEIEVFETWSGYVNVNMPVAKECSGGGGNSSSSKKASVNLSGSRFFIHPDMNVFASIGCEGIASLYNQSSGEKMSGCSSTCNGDSPLEVAKVEDGCHGYYCGQSEIAPRIPTNYYGKKLQRFRIGFDLLKPGSCRSAFLISDGFLNSNSSVVASIANSSFVPVVLQWNDFDFFSIQKENDVLGKHLSLSLEFQMPL